LFCYWVSLVIFMLSGGVLLTMKFQSLLQQQQSSALAWIWLFLVVVLGGYGVVMMRWGWCDQWCWWRRWVWCSSALVIVSIVMGGAGGWRWWDGVVVGKWWCGIIWMWRCWCVVDVVLVALFFVRWWRCWLLRQRLRWWLAALAMVLLAMVSSIWCLVAAACGWFSGCLILWLFSNLLRFAEILSLLDLYCAGSDWFSSSRVNLCLTELLLNSDGPINFASRSGVSVWWQIYGQGWCLPSDLELEVFVLVFIFGVPPIYSTTVM
jgi:hypothetical protein